jgi:hypothetical protein
MQLGGIAMRTLCGFCVVLIGASGLMAQNRSGFVTPVPVARSFGSVVQPGSSSGFSGVQRTTGSVIFPGGSTQIGIPGIPPIMPNFSSQRLGGNVQQNGMNRGGHRGGGAIYPYPVYVPAYYDNSYYSGSTTAPMVQPQQPNVTVIYPPQQANPVFINMGPQDNPYGTPTNDRPQQHSLYQPRPAAEEPAAEQVHFLLAFKDHSIYSAVAYWVDGDTVHYFTSGNTHNQASVSLIDRELTERLNRESGHEVKLPPVK